MTAALGTALRTAQPAHPALREAFLWLTTSPARGTAPIPAAEHLLMVTVQLPATPPLTAATGVGMDWVIDAQATPGQGALRWAGEDFVRPTVVASRRRLHRAWRPSSTKALCSFSRWPALAGPCWGLWWARAANPDLEVLVLVQLVWSRGP